MKEKIRILLMNSYSFDAIYAKWEEGINPSHFLMGKIELDKEEDLEVSILSHEKYKWLNKLGNLIKIPSLDQQVRALWRMKKYDILYLPYPLSNSRLITTLKFVGFISTPIVVLVHQPVFQNPEKKSISNWFARKSYLQFDAYACFSKNLMSKIIQDLKIDNKKDLMKFQHITWGADSHFYKKFTMEGHQAEEKFAVCAGTMDRDFDLIIEAFRGLNFNLKIFCLPSTVIKTKKIPPNVTIEFSSISYPELIKIYHKSCFVIISIKNEVKDKGNTYGLTGLFDSMAVGKPVIMTFHKFIDIDLEKENIGIWVRENTVDEWKRNLQNLIQNESELISMGRNSKDLYQSKYNSERFALQMTSIFKKKFKTRK